MRRKRVLGYGAAFFIVGSASLGAFVANAGDGRIEINQSRALAGGVTAGDAAGFPVTISQPGSFVLTGDLSVSGFTDAILLATDYATIDLAGHEIAGPTVCTGQGGSLSCPAVSAGAGVAGATRDGIRVKNGSIRGFLYGLNLGESSQISDMSFTSNRFDGMRVRDYCIVNRVIATHNGDEGLQGGNGCVISDITSRYNGDDGVLTLEGAVVMRATSQQNGGDGYQLSKAIVIDRSSAVLNGDEGIDIQAGAAVVARSAVTSNSGRGIQILAGAVADGGAVIVGNSVVANLADGINTGNGSVVIDNVLRNNQGTPIDCDAVSGENSESSLWSARVGNFVSGTIPGTGEWGPSCLNMNLRSILMDEPYDCRNDVFVTPACMLGLGDLDLACIFLDSCG